jgi:predicted DNA-binding transcriptional regulator AlpA
MNDFKHRTGELNDYFRLNQSLLWGISDMVNFLGVPKSSVFALVNTPGFPTPVIGRKRYRRWLPSEVMDFISKNRPTKVLVQEVFLNSDLVTR